MAQGVLRTLLHAVVDQGHIDVSELLLGHCVDMDVRNISGRTPLHLAVFSGHLLFICWMVWVSEFSSSAPQYPEIKICRILVTGIYSDGLDL